MARLLHRILPQHSRKCTTVFLACVWIFGIFCGIGSYSLAGNSIVPLMRMAALNHVSIVSLLAVSCLPFLISALIVYSHSYRLLPALCFIKAYLFGFVSMGVFIAFDTAGWLVRLLLMFSDILCLVPLWWFWIHHFSNRHGISTLGTVGCIGAVSLIVSLDYAYISPFLVRLLEF